MATGGHFGIPISLQSVFKTTENAAYEVNQILKQGHVIVLLRAIKYRTGLIHLLSPDV